MHGPTHAGPPGVAPSTGRRLAGIEGLRGIAAASIVLVHVWGTSSPGDVVLGEGRRVADLISILSVGVTLFFALSGFLLYRPFAAAIARGVPHQPIGDYLWNRFLRIAPAYWAILALTALVFGAAFIRDEAGTAGVGRMTNPFDLGVSALLLQDYRPSTMTIGIGPAWSLAVEAVFYCVLPILVLGAARVARGMRGRRERVLVLLIPPLLLLLIGLTGKAAAAWLVPGPPTSGWGASWHSVVVRSFWAQADLFSFGMLVAVLHAQVADGALVLPRRWRPGAVLAGAAVFLPCAWTMHQAEQSYVLQNTGEALALALFLAAVVIPARDAAARPLRAVRLLETRPLVALGVASYSVFLWHYPVIEWLDARGLTVGGWAGLLVNLVTTVVVVGALSTLTYRWVERPALLRKHGAGGAVSTPSAPVGALAVAPAPTSARAGS